MSRRRKHSSTIHWEPKPWQCSECGDPNDWHTHQMVDGRLMCAVDGCACTWGRTERYDPHNPEHKKHMLGEKEKAA